MSTSLFFIFYLAILLFSVIIHEISHGYMAKHLGDPTAEAAGRLTLNPIAHIDPFGSIILPLLFYFSGLPGLAWAKPVPYNPNNLYKDFKYGPLKVALVGPLSNIFLLVVFGLLARVAVAYGAAPFALFFGLVALVNALLAIFNLVPIPPLDGSKILPLIIPGFDVERIGFMGIFLVFAFVYFFSSIIFYLASHLFAFVAGGGATALMCTSGLLSSACF
mgnify:CR=1 FL=1